MSITLITGGQRSGKSQYAEQLALSLSPNPIYMATAHIWDDEFRQRVVRHQERRGPEWTNIEEERWLSRHDVRGRVVLVDCLTLWATNFFYADGAEADVNAALESLKSEFDRFVRQDATFIIVTNEIGSGGTPVNDVQRRFTDLLGWLNQYVAAKADEVVLMVSGILMNIPAELYESARIDGANPFVIFRKITFPYMLFVTTPYLITSFVGNINNFNVIFLLSQGGPTYVGDTAGQTDLLVTWLYKLTIDFQYYNIGAVIGILTFIVLTIVTLVTYRNSGSYKNEEAFM